MKNRKMINSFPLAICARLTLRMWRINCLAFFSYFITLSTIACFSAIVGNWIAAQSSHYALSDLNQISYCSFICPVLHADELPTLQKNLSVESLAYVSSIQRLSTPEAGELEVRAVAGDLTSLFQLELSEGRFFTSEELADQSQVCCVGQVTAQEKNLRPGDTLTIQGSKYDIIGIASIDSSYLDVLVPLDALYALQPNATPQQNLYCIATSPVSSQAMEIAFLTVGRQANIVSLATAHALQSSLQKQMLSSLKVYGLAGVVALAFTLFNLALVQKGKFEQYRYLYAIQRALGARTGQLFVQFTGENLLIAVVAALLALILLPAGLHFLGFEAFYYPNLLVDVVVLCIAVCSSLFVSATLFIAVSRLPIASVLQKEVRSQ